MFLCQLLAELTFSAYVWRFGVQNEAPSLPLLLDKTKLQTHSEDAIKYHGCFLDRMNK